MLIAATGIYRESQDIATLLGVGQPHTGCDLPPGATGYLRSAKFCRVRRVGYSRHGPRPKLGTVLAAAHELIGMAPDRSS
jgi:hypothetical protein